jgi:Spy/CpxP family protein refolding chaperone
MKASVTTAALLIGLAAPPAPASAQSHQPYAGQDKRDVKALSETEIADLLAGRGMGLAKAAELNGYPGPMHVLEHAAALDLSDEQRRAVEAIRARMSAAAQALGREVVAAERALDAAFVEGRIDEAQMKAGTNAIAALNGRLRAVHLAAHLETKLLLTPPQLIRYAALRGYGEPKQEGHEPRKH